MRAILAAIVQKMLGRSGKIVGEKMTEQKKLRSRALGSNGSKILRLAKRAPSACPLTPRSDRLLLSLLGVVREVQSVDKAMLGR